MAVYIWVLDRKLAKDQAIVEMGSTILRNTRPDYINLI